MTKNFFASNQLLPRIGAHKAQKISALIYFAKIFFSFEQFGMNFAERERERERE